MKGAPREIVVNSGRLLLQLEGDSVVWFFYVLVLMECDRPGNNLCIYMVKSLRFLSVKTIVPLHNHTKHCKAKRLTIEGIVINLWLSFAATALALKLLGLALWRIISPHSSTFKSWFYRRLNPMKTRCTRNKARVCGLGFKTLNKSTRS